MATDNKWSTGTQNAVLNALRTTFANGVMYIYDAAQPINGNAASQGVVLGIVTDSALPFTFGTPTNGLLFDAADDGYLRKAAAQTWQFKALSSGIAGWYRLFSNAADNFAANTTGTALRIDGRIATANASMIMPNTTVVKDAIYTIDTFVLPIPAAFR